jgi:hypothetical protein
MTKQSVKHETDGNLAYIKKRHELIFKATQLSLVKPAGVKKYTQDMIDRSFHRNMTVLAIEAGIIDEGNLVLFDAKKLPATGSVTFFNQQTV